MHRQQQERAAVEPEFTRGKGRSRRSSWKLLLQERANVGAVDVAGVAAGWRRRNSEFAAGPEFIVDPTWGRKAAWGWRAVAAAATTSVLKRRWLPLWGSPK